MPRDMSAGQIRSWLEREGWQYEFVGNAVASSTNLDRRFKWGVDIHASHFGRISDNVIYNVAGAGVQTETGHESYNLIARNFVARVGGLGRIQVPQPSPSLDVMSNIGRDGAGFWYRGGHNWIEGNVAADVRFAGHYVSRYYLRRAHGIPVFPGAASTESIGLRIVPVLSFTNQEAYGPMEQGLYGASVSGWLDAAEWPEVRIDRFVAWHPYFQQVEWFHNGKTTFTGLVLRGDPLVTDRQARSGADMRTVGMRLPHYENVNLTVRQADIRGLPKGIDLPTRTLGGTTRVVDSVLQNYVNLAILTKVNDANTEIRNVRFERFGTSPKRLTWGYNNMTLQSYSRSVDIAMDREARKVQAAASYRVRVFSFNGRVGDDFEVFDGRDVAPCAATRPTIGGTVCALQ
jgi:hypothetical protein